jgi:DNA-binding NtrC family response regulator
VFQEDHAAAGSLRACLAQMGFEVTCVRTFIEAAPFLAAGRSDVFLYCFPDTEWVRNAVLTEVRRANPTLPIVAITKHVSDELRQLLERFDLAELLPFQRNWHGVVEAVRKALGSSQAANGGRG